MPARAAPPRVPPSSSAIELASGLAVPAIQGSREGARRIVTPCILRCPRAPDPDVVVAVRRGLAVANGGEQVRPIEVPAPAPDRPRGGCRFLSGNDSTVIARVGVS